MTRSGFGVLAVVLLFVPTSAMAQVDTTVSDGDGDPVGGSVAVGQSFDTPTFVAKGDSLPILGHEIFHDESQLGAAMNTLLFRVNGERRASLLKADLAALPARVDVETIDGRLTDFFTIHAWNDFGLLVTQRLFVPYAGKHFVGTRLPSIPLRSTPVGDLTLRVTVSDGASVRTFDQPFVRSPGQRVLVF